jgi:hypothetical protein
MKTGEEILLPKPKEWDIFLSYRRSALTEKVARWLQNELQKEPVESTTGQRFDLDVFVDVTEPHRPDFQRNLTPILEHSRALIILADAGATRRKSECDYLYQELDWWADHRKKTPFIVLQLDSISGSSLLNDPKFKDNKWDKVNCLDCFFEDWESQPDTGKLSKSELLAKLRESIRDYGQVIHHEEVEKLKQRALIAWTLAAAALLALVVAGVYWAQAVAAKDDALHKQRLADEARLKEEQAKLRERGAFSTSYVQTAAELTNEGNNDLALAYLGRAVELVPDDASIREHFRWLVSAHSWPLRMSPDVDISVPGPNKHQLISFSASGRTICAVNEKTARFITLGSQPALNPLTLPENSVAHLFFRWRHAVRSR